MIRLLVILALVAASNPIYAEISGGFTFNQSDSTVVTDSSHKDTLLPLRPYYMHSFGVCALARNAYIAEYNFRFIPHLEFKLAGGTADHSHYNIMGYDQTKVTGRYIGGGISFNSTNYFKRQTTYHRQHGIVASVVVGQGGLHFLGSKEYAGRLYPNHRVTREDFELSYRFVEWRLGYEMIIDRVVRFDLYPIQFTNATILNPGDIEHQYIPAIGAIRQTTFNPGLGIHLLINQNKKEESVSESVGLGVKEKREKKRKEKKTIKDTDSTKTPTDTK